MKSNSFFTQVNIDKSPWQITHKDKILLIGSCFTDEIGGKFAIHGFDTLKNPFGTIYNPLSIANLLTKSANKEFFTFNDVIKSDEFYYLFAAHSDIRGKSEEQCLSLGNQTISKVNQYLQQSSLIIITLGTAWSYWYKEGNILMGNCHKIPSQRIDRRILSVQEIEKAINSMITAITEKANADIKFLFTVSPVRHIKEGFYDNKLSKSTLILALHNIMQSNKNAFYFPSYEIVMDELRDYRFYAKDLVHINEVAVEYIWEKFSETYFSQQTMMISEKYLKLFQMKNHKPFNPDSEGYKKHLKKIQELEKEIKTLYIFDM